MDFGSIFDLGNLNQTEETSYDVVMIGGRPAGTTAAIYTHGALGCHCHRLDGARAARKGRR
jgi:alkyl hydroperoxide reductase subunit AhpF